MDRCTLQILTFCHLSVADQSGNFEIIRYLSDNLKHSCSPPWAWHQCPIALYFQSFLFHMRPFDVYIVSANKTFKAEDLFLKRASTIAKRIQIEQKCVFYLIPLNHDDIKPPVWHCFIPLWGHNHNLSNKAFIVNISGISAPTAPHQTVVCVCFSDLSEAIIDFYSGLRQSEALRPVWGNCGAHLLCREI